MFKSLVSAVSEQRQEIKQALVLFPYFETWSPDLIAECCRVSSIVEFPLDRIILGPDTRRSHTVYFVLEGVCRMMRNLDVEIKLDSRRKTVYRLHKTVGSESFSSECKHNGYSSRLFSQMIYESERQKTVGFSKKKNAEMEDKPEVNVVNDSSEEQDFQKKEHPEMGENNVEAEKHVEELNSNENTNALLDANTNDSTDNNNNNQNDSCVTSTLKKTVTPSEELTLKQENETTEEIVTYEADHHLKVLEECRKRRKETDFVTRKAAPSEKPPNVKRFFIQIGFLFRGACFGLEKSERENFILSATTVRCLKIPEGFLLRHNPCNIWKRIGLFHSLYLPTDERVFERFRSDRMWVEGKKKLTDELVAEKNSSSCTSLSDTPCSIRLSEVR